MISRKATPSNTKGANNSGVPIKSEVSSLYHPRLLLSYTWLYSEQPYNRTTQGEMESGSSPSQETMASEQFLPDSISLCTMFSSLLSRNTGTRGGTFSQLTEMLRIQRTPHTTLSGTLGQTVAVHIPSDSTNSPAPVFQLKQIPNSFVYSMYVYCSTAYRD